MPADIFLFKLVKINEPLLFVNMVFLTRRFFFFLYALLLRCKSQMFNSSPGRRLKRKDFLEDIYLCKPFYVLPFLWYFTASHGGGERPIFRNITYRLSRAPHHSEQFEFRVVLSLLSRILFSLIWLLYRRVTRQPMLGLLPKIYDSLWYSLEIR